MGKRVSAGRRLTVILIFRVDLTTSAPTWLCPETKRFLGATSDCIELSKIPIESPDLDSLKAVWQRIRDNGPGYGETYQMVIDSPRDGLTTLHCHGYSVTVDEMIGYAIPVDDLSSQLNHEQTARFLSQQPPDLCNYIAVYGIVAIAHKEIGITFRNADFAQVLELQRDRLVLGELFAGWSVRINVANTPRQQSAHF